MMAPVPITPPLVAGNLKVDDKPVGNRSEPQAAIKSQQPCSFEAFMQMLMNGDNDDGGGVGNSGVGGGGDGDGDIDNLHLSERDFAYLGFREEKLAFVLDTGETLTIEGSFPGTGEEFTLP